MSWSDDAKKLVCGDRNTDYGPPRDDYVATAKMWSGFLSRQLTKEITPEQAILMMALLKVSRLGYKHKDDSAIDAHGYLTCYEWAITGNKPE